jgi:hypothetical protein
MIAVQVCVFLHKHANIVKYQTYSLSPWNRVLLEKLVTGFYRNFPLLRNQEVN